MNSATEFRRGQVAHNKLPVGSMTVRLETQTQKNRAWVKVAEPNVWRRRAVVVWESVNGAVPKGYVVHHKDHDQMNDGPDNLGIMTRGEHRNEHHDDLDTPNRTIRRGRR